MNRVSLLSALFLSLGGLHASVQVISTDVGQGNCSLVLAEDPDVPNLLVDGGSLDYKFKGLDFKKNQIEFIASTFKDHALKTKNTDCIVVVSHPDEDHYNWIMDIVKSCEKLITRFSVRKIFLGGDLPKYNKKFRDWIAKMQGASSSVAVVFPADSVASTTSTDIFSKPSIQLAYTLLPALPSLTDEEKNDASLVVHILFCGNCFLITGDATKKTTDHILQYYPTISAQFLLASHHGSTEEGCNDETWVKKLHPACIIVSSGLKIGHPHTGTVKLFLDVLNDRPGESHHLIAFGLDKDQTLLPQIGYKKEYGMRSTSKHLYGTLRHGTIVSTMKNDKKLSIARKTTPPGDEKTAANSVLKGCLSTSPEVFSLDSVMTIDLRGLGITDADATHKGTLLTLLKNLKNSPSLALRSLMLTDTTLADQDSVDALVALLQKNTSLRDLTILKAPLPAKADATITTAWNNRGLTFS